MIRHGADEVKSQWHLTKKPILCLKAKRLVQKVESSVYRMETETIWGYSECISHYEKEIGNFDSEKMNERVRIN